MKLKRFLLRYEPPGVGLEVETSAEVVVRHKDLPAASEVQSFQDVSKIVDDLIGEEPDLLSVRRHRPALLQLLGGRLYHLTAMDFDGEGNDAGKDADAGGAQDSSRGGAASPSPEASFAEGMTVCLIGLTGKLQIHNGDLGTLTKVDNAKGKYSLQMHATTANPTSEQFKVRSADHIVPIAPKSAGLTVGSHIAIRGLRNHIELNGCLGKVVECHTESHRYEVRATDSGQLFRVKAENLVPIDPNAPQVLAAQASAKENREPNASTTPRKKENSGFQGLPAPGSEQVLSTSSIAPNDADCDEDTFEPGSIVQLSGLRTAQCYNGQTAEVLSVDKARGRYEIRLGDGSVKTIRAENVTLISRSSKASPRTKQKGVKAADRGKA
jgi:hypothetical protein